MTQTRSGWRRWRGWVAALTVMGAVSASAQPETGRTTAEPASRPTVTRPVEAASQDASLITSPGELRARLRVGDRVRVTERNGDEWRGEVTRIGMTDCELVTEPSARRDDPSRLMVTMPYDVIAALERRRDSTLNGALIGAGVGGGAMLGVFLYMVAVDRNEMDEWAGAYAASGLVAAGIGALVGWGIDAAQSRAAFTYRPETTRATQVRIGPMISRNAAGLGVSVRF